MPPDPPTPSREFLTGARNTLPILLGVVPFGLFFGALALEVGLTPIEAQGFSLFVFAGSAQFVAVDLIRQGATPVVIVLTIFIVNLRHALYSASLAPSVAHLPVRWRAVMGWLLTDEAFAVATPRYRADNLERAHWYFLGTGLALWSCWQLSTAAGIVFGTQIPESWSLDFALPLTFLAMLIPNLVDRPAWAAAIAGGVLALLLRGLPYGLGLVVAVVLAVGIGVAVEARWRPRPPGQVGHDQP
jgi:4-azaleucine resistance transporter AzlC